MKKRKLVKKGLLFLIVILIISLTYSIFNIIKWQMENNKTKKLQEVLKENIKEEIITDEIAEEPSILDNYFINFDALKEINSEVVGYIKVENTNIESTIVKHNDNSYYLKHSFDKTWNSAGWLFADYKNKYDGSDKNYVVFGHARKDGSMFGTLKNVLNKEWQDGNNKIIFITENSKSIYEVFSVYRIKAEEYYITTDFKNDDEFKTFINKLKGRSVKDFNVFPTINDQLLTLSTCDSNNNQYRIVLHARKEQVSLDR